MNPDDLEKQAKKPTKSLKMLYENVRTIGIVSGILPKNFPTLKVLELSTLNVEAYPYGGMGGCNEFTRGRYKKPFIIINIESAKTAVDYIAVLAHEMLHIKQTLCEQQKPHHGNKFRKDCSKFSRILGITYWHINGYDKPTLKVFKAIQAKRMRVFLKDNAERKAKKDKPA